MVLSSPTPCFSTSAQLKTGLNNAIVRDLPCAVRSNPADVYPADACGTPPPVSQRNPGSLQTWPAKCLLEDETALVENESAGFRWSKSFKHGASLSCLGINRFHLGMELPLLVLFIWAVG